MKLRYKKSRHNDGPNHERWLVSYADFITLLFAFFVMLYAVSSLNEGKYKALSKALHEAFSKNDVKPIEAGKNESDISRQDDLLFGQAGNIPPVDSQVDHTLSQLADAISKQFQPLIAGGQIGIRREKDWIAIELKSNLLFEIGEGFPKKEAIPVLHDLAKVLKNSVNPLRVEGYTDNLPIENDLYPSNWDLSAARAASIVRKLQEFGVDPARMMAIGYGEQNSAVANDTEVGRARNRRVVIVIGENPKWH